MWLYIPAGVALIIKLGLLFYGRNSFKKNRQASTLLIMLVLLTVCNLMELFGIAYASEPTTVELALRVYYVSLILLFVFLFQLSILVVLTNPPIWQESLNYVIGLFVCYFILKTDFLISGIDSIGYSVTRIPGKYYWIVVAHFLSLLCLTLGVLIFGYIKPTNRYCRLQALYLLIGISFLAIPIIAALIFLALDLRINTALMLPIGVSLFLMVIAYAIKNDDLFDIRIWLPFTVMYKLNKAIFEEYQVSEDGSEWTAEERKKNHEKIYFLRLLIDHENNQSVVAKLLGVSESTVSKKRKEYNI